MGCFKGKSWEIPTKNGHVHGKANDWEDFKNHQYSSVSSNRAEIGNGMMHGNVSENLDPGTGEIWTNQLCMFLAVF